jgi:Zn-dependent protease
MLVMDMVEIGYKLGLYFVPFLFALCFHEFAHALVAKWMGDDTAERQGRLSLNPMVHADPLGTWILPILTIVTGASFFFGWAKPVPVDVRNLHQPKWKMFFIALAGPKSNVLLAVVSTVLLAVVFVKMRDAGSSKALLTLLQNFIRLNMFLAIFNLIPIHPLDGGKVAEPFLPVKWNYWLEQNQGMLSMGLFVFIMLGGSFLAIPVYYLTGHLLSFANVLVGLMS